MNFKNPIIGGLDKELVQHLETVGNLILEMDALEVSDQDHDKKLEELEKIREKLNKVRLEIDNIKNIIIMFSPDAHLN